jgi:2-hydroxychromene-2-carboxylate isomerase
MHVESIINPSTVIHRGVRTDAKAAARAGLSLAELDAAITADPQRHEERLAENNRSLRTAGHWGVPTMIFKGEPFFGQDRFDVLVWRMKQCGLEPRPTPLDRL